MDFVVRKYEDNDFLATKDLLKEAFGVERVLKSINDSNHFQLVACCEEMVVGYLLLTKVDDPIIARCYFLINYVCVKKEYQNKKIGYLLIREAEKIAKDNNAFYLQLTSSRFRTFAHKLYKSCGFVIRDSDIFRKVLE